MEQRNIFNAAVTQSAYGIREMHNIRVDVRTYGKYGQPEKTLKAAAQRLAGLVASGDIEMVQAEECLQECHDRIEHVILKPVDLAKLLKVGYREVQKSLKEKALKEKKALVDKDKQLAERIISERESFQRCSMKQIFQGLMFGLPEQKLYNDKNWENITGCWYLNPKAGFKCVGQEVEVEA